MKWLTSGPRYQLTMPRTAPTLAVLALLVSSCAMTPEEEIESDTARPLFISTWPFGKEANDVALATMVAGGSALDGVEQGIRRIEELSSDGSVGLGGRPNAAGYVQLDACITVSYTHLTLPTILRV